MTNYVPPQYQKYIPRYTPSYTPSRVPQPKTAPRYTGTTRIPHPWKEKPAEVPATPLHLLGSLFNVTRGKFGAAGNVPPTPFHVIGALTSPPTSMIKGAPKYTAANTPAASSMTKTQQVNYQAQWDAFWRKYYPFPYRQYGPPIPEMTYGYSAAPGEQPYIPTTGGGGYGGYYGGGGYGGYDYNYPDYQRSTIGPIAPSRRPTYAPAQATIAPQMAVAPTREVYGMQPQRRLLPRWYQTLTSWRV